MEFGLSLIFIHVPKRMIWGFTSRPQIGDLMSLFFYFGVHRSLLGMAQKWSILDQKWQDCQCSKVAQKGNKGTKMVIPSVVDDLGPFWALLDPFGPFQTKINLLPQMNKVRFSWGASEQIINFCLKQTKMVPMGPKLQRGSNWSKTLRLTVLVLFEPFWITLERWQACHVWPFLVQNGPFFAIPPQSWTLDPNTRKGSSPGLLCVACLETPKHAIGKSWTFCWEMDVVQKTPKTAFLSGQKSASPHFEGSWRQNCWHQENFWGTFKNFWFITEGQECTPMKFFLAGGQGN